LQRAYEEASAVIVPTRSDFEEGYAKVAAEAVLNLRPVVTSAACPALDDVRPAVIEASVNDASDYSRAVRLLANDEAVYRQAVSGATACREIYFAEENSFGAVVRPALRRAMAERTR
jgi:glycosyltransferase involved in cell wall biosynthesis